MSLAQLFYMTETIREHLRRWRQGQFRRPAQHPALRTSTLTSFEDQHPGRFLLESLESRVLLSVSIGDALVVESDTGSQALKFAMTLSVQAGAAGDYAAQATMRTR